MEFSSAAIYRQLRKIVEAMIEHGKGSICMMSDVMVIVRMIAALLHEIVLW